MDISEKILNMISAITCRGVLCSAASDNTSINMNSHLYTDLGIDSISFVNLLVDIEKEFSIEFALTEMSSCLQLGNLIALADKKYQSRLSESVG